MNLFTDIRELVLDCLQAMVAAGDLPESLDTAAVTVEPPRDAGHGDMATNGGHGPRQARPAEAPRHRRGSCRPSG